MYLCDVYPENCTTEANETFTKSPTTKIPYKSRSGILSGTTFYCVPQQNHHLTSQLLKGLRY